MGLNSAIPGVSVGLSGLVGMCWSVYLGLRSKTRSDPSYNIGGLSALRLIVFFKEKEGDFFFGERTVVDADVIDGAGEAEAGVSASEG